MGNIGSHSIFGNYSQTENRVTAAFLQILKIGGTEFIARVLAEIEEIEFPSSEIRIETQEKGKHNVYDGLLECDFSFKVLVESKIKPNSINAKQLKGLIENAKGFNDYIIYITPDNSEPEILKEQDKKIYWANWKQIVEILKELNPDTEPISFLINEFDKYLDFLNLLEVVSPDQRVQVAAGSWGEPIALNYGFYACQNHRTIRDSKYLAFYNNRKINYLFEIIDEPKNDFILSESDDKLVQRYLKEKEPNYTSDSKRQFYKLKLVKENLNIKHHGRNKSDKRTAYTMGVFRYTTYDKLISAKTTEDL